MTMSAQPNIGMQPTTFANPMGVDGFEFVEFAAPDAKLLHALFPKLGFTAVAKHRSRAVTLYRQGGCNFLVNEEPDSFAADFVAKHGFGVFAWYRIALGTIALIALWYVGS